MKLTTIGRTIEVTQETGFVKLVIANSNAENERIVMHFDNAEASALESAIREIRKAIK